MTQSAEYKNLGFCGVDCFACTDYTEGKCPSCMGHSVAGKRYLSAREMLP